MFMNDTFGDSALRMSISVVIPYYNQPHQIQACLSALQSTLIEGDEIIVVDDASVYPLALNTEKIKYIRLKENIGPSAARNKGVEAASNDFVAFMDADDIPLAERFNYQVKALNDNPEWIACVGDYIYIRGEVSVSSKKNKEQNYFDIRQELLSGNMYAAGSTLMFRKRFFLMLGGYDAQLRVYEDWDLLLRAVNFGVVGHCGAEISLVIGSTKRAGIESRINTLTALKKMHYESLLASEKKIFLSALAYEKISASSRGGAYMEALRALAIALYCSPRQLLARVFIRLFYGRP